MGFRAYLFTYVFGGLTFIPLLIAAIVLPAWYLQPRVDIAQKEIADGEGETRDAPEGDQPREEQRSRQTSGDVGASGTFAVLRRYDFQAAIAAFHVRNPSSGPGGGDGAAQGDGLGGAGSESVYQSMYRSVFTGNKNPSTASLLQNDDTLDGAAGRRKSVPANMLYIVLRHGHLMLYESPAQVEVKHVLSLSHHSVSLQAGRDEEEDAMETNILEADLFIKRTAIVLTPVDLPTGSLQSPSQTPARPFYLFSATNIEKEDFYHALLASRACPPTPRPLDADALIKLQSALHSSSLTPETRALNSIISRVFLSLHRTELLRNLIRSKMERKLARIQKPTFIPSLRVQSIDLGDAAPMFTNLKLRDLNIDGAMTVEANMKYNGGLSITLLAVAKLDLGARFKTRTVDLVLKTSVQRISGPMLLHIKPPPSNRVWFCFESTPDMDIGVEPVVSDRKITYGFVVRAIEERLRTVISEGLVKPNWDDIPMPFSDTRGTPARGGLWSNPGKPDRPAVQPDVSAHTLAERNEKTNSMPTFPQEVDSGVSTGLSSNSEINLTKLRHSATMPVDIRQQVAAGAGPSELGSSPERSPRPPKPLRSPSVSTAAGVATDDQNAERVRPDDASLRSNAPQTRNLWRPRGQAGPPTSQKDALAELRGLQTRSEQAASKPSIATSAGDEEASRRSFETTDTQDHAMSEDEEAKLSRQPSDSSASTIPATPRSFSIRSTESDRSTAPSPAATTRSEQLQLKKANILAATAAATTAARNWGWNAIQRNKGTSPLSASRADQSPEPMGRGQPLPPPGQPLPGPPKGIWGGMGGMGTLRRKPVSATPPRQPPGPATEQDAETSKDPSEVQEREVAPESSDEVGEEEFEPWQENSGLERSGSKSRKLPADSDLYTGEDFGTVTGSNSSARSKEAEGRTSDTPEALRKVPPPLPARRRLLNNTSGGNAESTAETDASQSGDPTQQSFSVKDIADAPALHVPESTASAIAAENSTPARAEGSDDDTAHASKSEAVDADIVGDTPEGSESWSDTAKAEAGSETQDTSGWDEEEEELAEDKFIHGQDVSERDFERPEAEDLKQTKKHPAPAVKDAGEASRGVPATSPEGDDEVLARVRARVEERTPAVEKKAEVTTPTDASAIKTALGLEPGPS